MPGNQENIRELKDIQEPLFIFKHLKSDLDILKSQINNLKSAKLSSKLLKGINLKKRDVLDVKLLEFTGGRLSQSLKNVRAKEVSIKLQKHPEDSKSRLELAEIFLQEADNRSLEKKEKQQNKEQQQKQNEEQQQKQNKEQQQNQKLTNQPKINK